jgi:tripeptidyl-peptidase-1
LIIYSLLLSQAFLQLYRSDLVGSNFSTVSVDGGINPQGPGNAGPQADFDIGYTVGIASGVPTTFFTVGQNNPDGVGGLIDIVNSMMMGQTVTVVPNVWTHSYGLDEDDLDSTMTA